MNELLLKELDKYIEENLVVRVKKEPVIKDGSFNASKRSQKREIDGFCAADVVITANALNYEKLPSIDEIVKDDNLDESFSEMVIRKTTQKNISEVDCYTKAGLDRRHFSKIRSDKNYRPSKQTALALAIALELPLKEIEEMLKKAGYALSNSNKADVIVKYFIKQHNYDLAVIDECLLHYDQKTLKSY